MREVGEEEGSGKGGGKWVRRREVGKEEVSV